jgi:L-fuconolactonase
MDLRPLISEAGISKTVLVQVAQTEDETAFLLDIAKAEPFVAGVVGWTDLEAVNAADRVRAMAEEPGLLGFRPMIQDLTDDHWMLRSSITPALKAMADLDLVFDALVTPRHLAVLPQFLDAYPDLRVVVDHAAKPDIAGGGLRAWVASMRTLASESAATCKLSGLVTEAAADWTLEDLRPYVDVLLETFGPARLMWGSDWPVVNLNGTYDRWLSAAEALLAGVSDGELDLIFGGVAKAVYRIET